MNNNCCKESEDRVGVYMISTGQLNEGVSTDTAGVLVDVLGYTRKQADTALNFVGTRSECLLYVGGSSNAMDVIDKLSKRGIKCRAKPWGIVK